MHVVPHQEPSPRLLSTAALAVENRDGRSGKGSKARLQREGMFTGNGRAIFVGLALGALLISATAFLANHHHAFDSELAAMRKFFAVRTRTVVTPSHPAGAKRVAVDLSAASLRVTAIALGHPRMAIINGKEIVEGDSLTVQSRDAGVSVTLKVLKIADGEIDLTDGSQIVTTRMLSHRGR